MPRKKGGGGKLNRTETIQARLDPKLYMAAEIMARIERRTLSSFLERSIEQESKTYKIKRNLFFPWWSEDPELYCRNKIYSKSDTVTIEEAVQMIGTEHESIRFLKFAVYFPDLLNKDEEEMFNKIIFTKYFWMHYPVNIEDQKGKIIDQDWVQVDALEGIVQENLLEYWHRIQSKQISLEILSELPPGKKIHAPLSEDSRAIKKIIKTGDRSMPYRKVFAWNDENKFEISLDDAFWKKYSIFLVAQKIEIEQAGDREKMVATLRPTLDKKGQKIWTEFCKKKMEDQDNGN